jgi:hypothetical protein
MKFTIVVNVGEINIYFPLRATNRLPQIRIFNSCASNLFSGYTVAWDTATNKMPDIYIRMKKRHYAISLNAPE